jgi:3-methylcrotonyl-CoA carboxylase alpha subunit
MIAKLIVHAPSRNEALGALNKALDEAVVIGPKTNLSFLRALLGSPEIASGGFDTSFIDAHLARLGAAPRAPDERAVIAAAQLLLRRDSARASPLAPFDPWGVADSFELVGQRRVGLDVMVDGKPELLHLAGAGIEAAESRKNDEPPRAEVTLHEAAGGVYAFTGGRQAFVSLVDPLERAAGGADEDENLIRAPMNGRLVALNVTEGEAVEAGRRLAVVEAMKMEHALIAPRAGRVRELVVKLGDQVEMGATILRIAGEEEG